MSEPNSIPNGPFRVALEEGKKYAWCACGKSADQPFCDGAHRGTGITPVVFTADETTTTYLCGCKETGSSPFCDGTHSSL